MSASENSVDVYVFPSTLHGHVLTGYQHGIWMVHRSGVGGAAHRAKQAEGMPCLFYVSKGSKRSGGYFCGPGIIHGAPSDEFATQHAGLFGEADWCLGFPFEPLANDVSTIMKEDAIRQLQVVRDGRGNYSQDLNLTGRCIFLPSRITCDDARAILTATGAFSGAYERWMSCRAPRADRTG